MRSCCPHGQRLPCHVCQPSERRTVNVTQLKWPMATWVALYASLELSKAAKGVERDGEGWPVCTHPLCTGADRKRFP